MVDQMHESLQKSLNRWERTEPNDTEGVGCAMARIYDRFGHPAPAVIWCDSPWQLAVAPFLMRLVCFNPSEVQRRRLGEAYDYDSLRHSIKRTLETNLTDGLWRRAFTSLMSQLHPELEKALTGTTIDKQGPDWVPAPAALEEAASKLSPPDALNLDWNDPADKPVKARQTSSAFASIMQRRSSLIALYREYLPQTMYTRGRQTMRWNSQTWEAAGRLRLAFEQNFRADTGVSIKELDGLEAPSIGVEDLLAHQFQQQMGDPSCRQICNLLTSSTELSALGQVCSFFGRPVLPPVCFGHNNFAVVKSLLHSDILPIAKAMRTISLSGVAGRSTFCELICS